MQQARSPYWNFYTNASNDPYQDDYTRIMAEYATTANTPQELRTKVFTSGNAGTPMSHLILTRDPTTAGMVPGNILSYHRATKYDARVGQAPTPFDNRMYAFMGDSLTSGDGG